MGEREERDEQCRGKVRTMKRGKKAMNIKEGKEGSWKRGKKGMNNEEGKEEPWKRGKVKPEKREGEMTNKVEKEKPRKNVQKLASLAFGHFFEVFPFPLYWPPLRPFFRFGRPSLPWFYLSLFIVHLFLA